MSQIKDQFITNAAEKNEDLHDLRIIAERKKEPTISFDTMKKKLVFKNA